MRQRRGMLEQVKAHFPHETPLPHPLLYGRVAFATGANAHFEGQLLKAADDEALLATVTVFWDKGSPGAVYALALSHLASTTEARPHPADRWKEHRLFVRRHLRRW